MSLLDMKQVSFSQGADTIINNVSLSIEKGSISAFLGKPGCGKSTSLKLLAGLVIPTSGKVFFEDKNIHSLSRKQNLNFRKRAAFMFQDSALWANQDLYNNLELPLRTHYPDMEISERRQRILETVKKVEFHKSLSLRPAALSIGEQKKIGFARALICNPEILFLDEPTESLDEKTANLFISILKEFCYNGNTMIYVSHDYNFIDSFENDKYYFENGVLADKVLARQDDFDSYDD